jgi:hypothetical protein
MRPLMASETGIDDAPFEATDNSEGARASDNQRTGFLHWYVYPCVESTETRGMRKDQTRIPACGFTNIRKMKHPIGSKDYNHPEQGAKCKNCGRRPRLNAGIMTENAINEYQYFIHNQGDEYSSGRGWVRDGVFYGSRSRTGPADVEARKQWALDEQARRNQAWASNYSTVIEEGIETNEQVASTNEEVGDLNE